VNFCETLPFHAAGTTRQLISVTQSDRGSRHCHEAAGKWEFPGGKVEPGETDAEALVRECREELGVRVEVGERVGPDVPLAHGRAVLRVYAVRLLDGDVPRALEHTAMRWLAADELDTVPWLPADRPIVAELPALLLRELPA
jgi:8-oxo-dGTP diphosphatase